MSKFQTFPVSGNSLFKGFPAFRNHHKYNLINCTIYYKSINVNPFHIVLQTANRWTDLTRFPSKWINNLQKNWNFPIRSLDSTTMVCFQWLFWPRNIKFQIPGISNQIKFISIKNQEQELSHGPYEPWRSSMQWYRKQERNNCHRTVAHRHKQDSTIHN